MNVKKEELRLDLQSNDDKHCRCLHPAIEFITLWHIIPLDPLNWVSKENLTIEDH